MPFSKHRKIPSRFFIYNLWRYTYFCARWKSAVDMSALVTSWERSQTTHISDQGYKNIQSEHWEITQIHVFCQIYISFLNLNFKITIQVFQKKFRRVQYETYNQHFISTNLVSYIYIAFDKKYKLVTRRTKMLPQKY